MRTLHDNIKEYSDASAKSQNKTVYIRGESKLEIETRINGAMYILLNGVEYPSLTEAIDVFVQETSYKKPVMG